MKTSNGAKPGGDITTSNNSTFCWIKFRSKQQNVYAEKTVVLVKQRSSSPMKQYGAKSRKLGHFDGQKSFQRGFYSWLKCSYLRVFAILL